MRAEAKKTTHAEELVEEYIQVKRLSEDYVNTTGKEQLVNEAVQFMHLLLLRDLRPPWLAYNFPQALPGEGVLSRFTRPLLLFWPADQVISLFGHAMHMQLSQAAHRVGLMLAGVIARPLYKCMEVKDASTGEICMNVASMSHFFENSANRSAYQCKDCVAKAQTAKAAPGPASAALRGLWAYPMVESVDGKPTPLRVAKKNCLLVHAPPDTWGYKPAQATATAPKESVWGLICRPEPENHSGWLKYNASDSASIWSSSTRYKGTPPVPQSGARLSQRDGVRLWQRNLPCIFPGF